MIVALQADDLLSLNPAYDSSLYLCEEADRRSLTLFHYTPDALTLTPNGLTATGHYFAFVNGRPTIKGEATLNLNDASFILIRQDPPFDMAYITATYLLETLDKSVKVINHPKGLRDVTEKLSILKFKDYIPESYVTRDKIFIKTLLQEKTDLILKPLYACGGRDILYLSNNDVNIDVLLDMMCSKYKEPFMVQEFLKAVHEGDKRIIMINGEAKAIFKRLPSDNSIRSNTVVGGHYDVCDFSQRDLEICNAVGSCLKEKGLYFCGLDVIGNTLTEINVTSPTGLKIVEELYQKNLAKTFWNGLL